jgi:hypothetical protein
MMIGLGDNPGQPHVRKIRAGDIVAGRALRGTPSAAEQRAGERQREELVEPRARLSARHRRGISGLGNLVWRLSVGGSWRKFQQNNCTEDQAPGEQQVNHKAISHSFETTAFPLLRKPVTPRQAQRPDAAEWCSGRTKTGLCPPAGIAASETMARPPHLS